jgi:hypothetical protein
MKFPAASFRRRMTREQETYPDFVPRFPSCDLLLASRVLHCDLPRKAESYGGFLWISPPFGSRAVMYDFTEKFRCFIAVYFRCAVRRTCLSVENINECRNVNFTLTGGCEDARVVGFRYERCLRDLTISAFVEFTSRHV